MLSPAEQNVYKHLILGLTNQEIADRIFVSEKTVKFHLTSIFDKLGVKTRGEAIAQAQSNQYILQDSPKEKEDDMADFKPVSEVLHDRRLESGLSQGARQVQVVQKSQEEKVEFVNKTFLVDKTIDHLHSMMVEVTKNEMNPNTVNAACNCVARLNETINTAIQAARFLNGR